ncbi:biopolymer transporter ExbD [Ruficoccus sp. ZRK36]|jgi:biopolymer transport protein ExbD|uniref:ExbD/TolR family protein n=1 Tax=Ruficoccus sp. ZRK36 TaxID=2866311 RepID=UPI001C7356CE|nr:biopolymer transporter ExbD [Ruficoccus sp. ZRK36]QYY34627.1 biopolymer transporter ExbD [Ruficoccus sp. ZRK36]
MDEPVQVFAASPPKRARIEIIPLIDVIFFLLATFILFTLSLQKSGGLPVSLPKADSGEGRIAEDAVTVTLTREGTLAWDKEPVTLDEFIARLQAYKAIEPDPKILLNGDEDASFVQARYVIDEIRKAGVNKILFETKLKPK